MWFEQGCHTFQKSVVEGEQNCTEERKFISVYK